MKNYLGQVLGLTLLILLFLTGISLVPEGFPIGDFRLKKMDIFADIRGDDAGDASKESLPPADSTDIALSDSPSLLSPDTAQALEQGPWPPKDSALFGRIIEDYTFDQSGLERFFSAIDSIKYGRTVRIAWYGDSFVEGDILIGDLRDSLQSLWGGNGVGFVPVTSEVARFKRTLTHNFSGWNTYSIIKKNGAHPPYGINGFAYRPRNDARVRYDGMNYFHHTRQWSQLRLFYSDTASSQITFRIDGGPEQTRALKAGGLQVFRISQPGMHTVEFRFSDTSGLTVYGATLEDNSGFYIDNFSVRGNSGGPLKLLQPAFIKKFDKQQQYDLVIIQVGLNAVTNSLKNIKWYEAELDRTFRHLRECFPEKPILVISVGDRAGKSGSELATMRGVPAIVDMQRTLARKYGFLFYDLFRGMGGPGAMIRLANQKPMLANKDYTHLTHEGGRVIGHMFVNLFLEEQSNWRARQPEQ